MTADLKSDRYRKVAEKELVQGNPRDPVLNQSIEAAAENGSDLTEEYAQRRAGQMLAHEDEHETARIRRMELNRELDDQQPGTLMRTTLLVMVTIAVIAVGFWLLKR